MFTYPKLFINSDSNSARAVMFGPLRLVNEKIKFDSICRDSIYPILQTEEGMYTIATIVMRMTMITDSVGEHHPRKKIDSTLTSHAIGLDTYPAPGETLMRVLIGGHYNMETLDYKEVPGGIISNVRIATIAAKDKFAKEWCFFTVGSDQELLNEIFSVAVLKRLSAYIKDE
jgi:hypothetical protein